jgi:hypothetical protein
MLAGFQSLGQFVETNCDIREAFPLLSITDLKELNRKGIRLLRDLDLLDDKSYADHFSSALILELRSFLVRHLFEERQRHQPLDEEFLKGVAVNLCYRSVPEYARNLALESLPFLSKRTRNCLRRNNLHKIVDLEPLDDIYLMGIPSFGATCLLNLKASLMSVPDRADLARVIAVFVNDDYATERWALSDGSNSGGNTTDALRPAELAVEQHKPSWPCWS